MDFKSLKESRKVEFKSSFEKEVIITLAAFANTRGGKVILGLDDKGKVTGIDLGPETEQKYLNDIKTSTYPQLIPHSDVYEVEGKTVLIFEINEYPVKPVACKNRYYKRVKNSNHMLSLEEIVDLRQQSLDISFDSHEVKESLADLDISLMEKFTEIVAEAFFLTGDIEKYGTGFIRIRKQLNELKTATYKIDEVGDFFRVKLLDTRSYDLEKDSVNGFIDPAKEFSDVEKDVENITYDVEKDVEKKFNLSKNQILILKSIQKNRNLTQENLSKIVGITLRNIQNNMIKLKEKGVLKRIGPDKGGYWKVIVKLPETDKKNELT